MDYSEYKQTYQKVILKELLRNSISIKQGLIDTIRNSDRQDSLELFFYKCMIFKEKLQQMNGWY